jgi:hypothetical protein
MFISLIFFSWFDDNSNVTKLEWVAGQALLSNPAALNKGVSRFPGDPGADEPAQVATEEVQEHHRENVDVEDEEALPHKSRSIIRHGRTLQRE